MRFGFILPSSEPRVCAELAALAEASGWDGVFIPDCIAIETPTVPPQPAFDPWVALAAMAAATRRVRLGTMLTAVPRRRPWKLAREVMTLDHLSGGRAILAAGLGAAADDGGFYKVGEAMDLKTRAERLDEGLALLDALWRGEPVTVRGEYLTALDVTMLPRPVQRPRIPIWIGGRWPNKAPFRRAARWDGVMPTHRDYGLGETMPPDELRAALRYTREQRSTNGPFDVALEGWTDGAAPDRGAGHVAPYLDAGLTWWIEALGWWRGSPADAMTRIRQGPPPLT